MMGANSAWGKTGIIWKDSWYNVKKGKNIILPMHIKYFTFFPNNFLQNKFKIYKIYFKVYTPQDFAAPLTEFVTVWNAF